MEWRRFNVLPFILLAVLLFLQYRLWFESGGIIDMMHLKKRLAVLQMENDGLKRNNQMLSFKVQNLKNNQGALESRARQELGMIKKGETFYHIVNPAKVRP